MPKIRGLPPRDHETLAGAVPRGANRRLGFYRVDALLESDIDVPEGMWFKRFAKFTLAGEGETPKTFLAPGMVPKGEEVR